jgi:nucleoside-diphosphate-sugar epimerase
MMKTPENSKATYDESDWSDLKACPTYEKSKTLAEQAAWDYQRSLPEGDRFELVTINPSLILGPALIASDFTSGALIQKIMSGAFPGMPKVQFPLVDVRDVALAHLRAITVPEAKDNRFVLNHYCVWFKDIAIILQNHYGSQYPIKTSELKYCTLKLASWFDESAKVILPLWGQEFNVLNDKSKRILGIEYHKMDDTLVSMAESMIEAGLIKDKRKKK